MSDDIPSHGELYVHALKTIDDLRNRLKSTEAALDSYASEAERLKESLEAILKPTNFISLSAARDYVSEVLGRVKKKKTTTRTVDAIVHISELDTPDRKR